MTIDRQLESGATRIPLTRERMMPPRIDLGRQYSSTMAACMGQYRDWRDGKVDTHGRRTVMGYVLPDWQRGLVWTKVQKVSFIESAWLGISIGTYTYNQAGIGSKSDHLLIDGQQRMSAIQDYLEDEFEVFGCKWSEVSERDERRWGMTTIFASYVTSTEDEDYLRGYYNLMNFGGTAHKESEQAERAASILVAANPNPESNHE